MKVKITESQLTKSIHKYLDMTIKGFDNCDYDWADFNCGMGVCCDPYAIGFSLPDKNHDDYLFKLVDGEFDTIIIYEELYASIRKFFGPINIWRDSLLTVLNITYGFNARTLMSDVIYDW